MEATRANQHKRCFMMTARSLIYAWRSLSLQEIRILASALSTKLKRLSARQGAPWHNRTHAQISFIGHPDFRLFPRTLDTPNRLEILVPDPNAQTGSYPGRFLPELRRPGDRHGPTEFFRCHLQRRFQDFIGHVMYVDARTCIAKPSAPLIIAVLDAHPPLVYFSA
jgi:hypothetical protein